MNNQILDGITYTNTGERARGEVQRYHQKPNPQKRNKTTFVADVIGLKPVERSRAILSTEDGHESKFTSGIEVEKNSLHRGAVKERNKVFDLFLQAEKIIDSRYSPADKRCGGHVTVTCKGMRSDDLRKALRPFCGIIHALFEKRLLNTYCNGNLRMEARSEGWANTRYQFALEKSFADGSQGLEFRIVARFESVKQTLRRYELFYALLDTAVNAPNTSHEKFLSRIRPIIVSMYGGNEADADLRIEKARHYRRFIMQGRLSSLIARAVDPHERNLSWWDAAAR